MATELKGKMFSELPLATELKNDAIVAILQDGVNQGATADMFGMDSLSNEEYDLYFPDIISSGGTYHVHSNKNLMYSANLSVNLNLKEDSESASLESYGTTFITFYNNSGSNRTISLLDNDSDNAHGSGFDLPRDIYLHPDEWVEITIKRYGNTAVVSYQMKQTVINPVINGLNRDVNVTSEEGIRLYTGKYIELNSEDGTGEGSILLISPSGQLTLSDSEGLVDLSSMGSINLNSRGGAYVYSRGEIELNADEDIYIKTTNNSNIYIGGKVQNEKVNIKVDSKGGDINLFTDAGEAKYNNFEIATKADLTNLVSVGVLEW